MADTLIQLRNGANGDLYYPYIFSDVAFNNKGLLVSLETDVREAVYDKMYPIGTIIVSSSPLEQFMDSNIKAFQTWHRVSEGKILAGHGAVLTADTGEYAHQLIREELATHNHGLGRYRVRADASATEPCIGYTTVAGTYLSSEGLDMPHNNVMPYYA